MTQDDISDMVAFIEKLEAELEIINQQWKSKSLILKRMLEEDLPLAMAELNFTDLSTPNHKIKISDKWSASIPQYRRNEVADYVENELDLPTLVSRVLKQSFKPADIDYFNEAKEQLDKSQVPYETFKDINTGSLKKAVKELLAKGEEVDLQKVCVTKQQIAIIKRIDNE